MQIIGPDGKPIESAEQLQAAQQASQQLADAAPAQTIEGSSTPVGLQAPAAPAPAPVVPTKAPATTIDALEREFQKRKERELNQAKQAGAAAQSDSANSPHISGQKVGRNEKCPCGSGKKFKNCHGAAA